MLYIIQRWIYFILETGVARIGLGEGPGKSMNEQGRCIVVRITLQIFATIVK